MTVKQNEDALGDMMLLGNIKEFLKIQVFALETAEQAIAAIRMDREGVYKKSITDFAKISDALLKAKSPKAVLLSKKGGYRKNLATIIEACPGHATARFLFNYTKKKHPRHLTVSASLTKLGIGLESIRKIIRNLSRYSQSKTEYTMLKNRHKQLSVHRKIIHPELKDVYISHLKFMKSLERLRKFQSANMKKVRKTSYRKRRDVYYQLIDKYRLDFLAAVNELEDNKEYINAILH